MIGQCYLVSRDDRSALIHAAAALRMWEPLWDLDVPPRHARLYDPEATVYGVCLSPMTVPYNHRTERAECGDLLIVPREFALDIEPEVDLFALRHAGAPPDHFRERFIQVWGFERLKRQSDDPRQADWASIIPPGDTRYPLTYRVEERADTSNAWQITGITVTVLIILEGRRTVMIRGANAGAHTLGAGDALLVGPGLEFACPGEGLMARATLFTALDHEARRDAAARTGTFPGPEFDPASRSTGSGTSTNDR